MNSDERYFARSIDQLARRVVYGHTVRDGGRDWLQYGQCFAYNPQDRGIPRTGRHEGDWELLQIRLDGSGTPDKATLSQHSWAAGCDWSQLRREGSTPVLYVANGSHALYPSQGTADRRAWVEGRERWGDSRASLVPGEQSSPVGPEFQEDGAWDDPAPFHADRARGCFEGPPGRWWLTGLASLGALGLAMALILLVRRFLQSLR